jgi:predicted metal-dependent HD superfamily phosphohydrolase
MHFIIKNTLNSDEENYLRDSFKNVCMKLRISETAQEALYHQLYFEYSGWNRHYHNLSHIYNLLRLADEFKNDINENELFQLSVWFHDFIYDINKKDNEEQSAEWANKLLSPFLKNEQIKYIETLILSTKKHVPIDKSNLDNLLFLDLDLSILASDSASYNLYAEAVRDEYKSLFSFLVYNAGRTNVLNNFLKREKIYFSEFFQKNYESKARDNIKSEIKSLRIL